MDSGEWLPILREAAENIYSTVSQARRRGVGLETREYKHLLDDVAQSALISTLERLSVPAQLVSEEGDATICGGGSIIISDPIDGTTNIARGLPPAVTCISVSSNCNFSETIAAVIKDLYNGDTYTAEAGHGAKLNGEPIKVAVPRQTRASLISMDITKTPKLKRVTPLLNTCRYLRMLGSSATELSLVSAGTLDAHLDVRGTLRATDVAAALLLLTEAGGTYAVNGVIGGDFPLTRGATMELIATSNKPLLDELLTLTKASA